MQESLGDADQTMILEVEYCVSVKMFLFKT